MAKKILRLVAALFFFLPVEPLSADTTGEFLDAPYQCIVLKQDKAKKKRFRELISTGRFLICRVDLFNQDTVEHTIDYACFCAVSADGTEYEVNTDATWIKQDENAEWNPRKDLDVWGFSRKTIRPKFKQTGWLIFEVPAPGKYKIKFRGYLK